MKIMAEMRIYLVARRLQALGRALCIRLLHSGMTAKGKNKRGQLCYCIQEDKLSNIFDPCMSIPTEIGNPMLWPPCPFPLLGIHRIHRFSYNYAASALLNMIYILVRTGFEMRTVSECNCLHIAVARKQAGYEVMLFSAYAVERFA